MGNRLISTPNYIIMGITTVISTIFHIIMFLAQGAGMLILYTTVENAGTPDVGDYAAIIVMFVFFMLHTFTLICLLEGTPRRRSVGYSVVTVVLELLICPAYALVGFLTIGAEFNKVLFIFCAMLLFSFIGNIYCVIRHTITK
jgi:hypothetical protein